MSIRSMMMLVLAAICALAASYGVYQFTAVAPTPVAQPVEDEEIVTLVVDATRVGTELTADMLEISRVPKGTVREGTVRRIPDAVGQSVVIPMFRGEPILTAKLGAGTGLAALVPNGMVAFTFQAPSESSLMAGFAMPNDRVDILLTRADPAKLRGGKVTQRLVQNVRILAAGAELNRPAGNRVERVRNVTVAVPPGVDQKLAMAQEVGSLTLVLRSAPDDHNYPNSPIYLADLEGAEEPALAERWDSAFSHFAKSIEMIGESIDTVARNAADQEIKRLNDQLKLQSRQIDRLNLELDNANSAVVLANTKLAEDQTASPSTVLTIRGNAQSYVIVKPKKKETGY